MQSQNTRFIVVQQMPRKVAFQNREVPHVARADKFSAQQKLNMLGIQTIFAYKRTAHEPESNLSVSRHRRQTYQAIRSGSPCEFLFGRRPAVQTVGRAFPANAK